jgi:hypothetical protein
LKTVLHERRIAMKKLNYLIILSILVALILAMVAIVPAGAGKPGHYLDRWTLDFDYNDCGFTIPNTHLEAKEVVTNFYNVYGIPWETSVHYGGTTWTMTYNGHTLVWRDVENSFGIEISPTETLITNKGLNWSVIVPGHGFAYATIGKIVLIQTCPEDGDECTLEPIEFSGFNINDLDTVCNYMLNGK